MYDDYLSHGSGAPPIARSNRLARWTGALEVINYEPFAGFRYGPPLEGAEPLPEPAPEPPRTPAVATITPVPPLAPVVEMPARRPRIVTDMRGDLSRFFTRAQVIADRAGGDGLVHVGILGADRATIACRYETVLGLWTVADPVWAYERRLCANCLFTWRHADGANRLLGIGHWLEAERLLAEAR